MRLVRAELKSLDSVAAVEGFDRFSPHDQKRFGISVVATVGPHGEEGGELFYFDVVTASWLADDQTPKGFAFRRILLVSRWDHDMVRRAISDLCRRTEGESWDEIATKLSRFGHWEFEDYAEAP